MANTLKILVIGQGGREHALVRALQIAPSQPVVEALPGSDGMATEVVCHKISIDDFEGIVRVVGERNFGLVIIGPEVPLADGLADVLRAQNVLVFGPSKAAAQLEGSKIFAKKFMVASGVPTAKFAIVNSVADVEGCFHKFTPPYVLKADGLCAGKGVFICKTRDELMQASRLLFSERIFGDAGAQALLEQFTPGYEISYLVLTNGHDFEPLILSQDHKRIGDGDTGPNTGGMGTAAPVKISSALDQQIRTEVLQPVMRELTKQNLFYRGVLYVGLMITDTGPSVIEFNARFGDPETQVIMPLLEGDWAEAFKKISQGEVPRLKWSQQAAVCVVVAAEGYPDTPRKGVKIEGLPSPSFAKTSSSTSDTRQLSAYWIHAGTRFDQSQNCFVTGGGRVLNAIGIGPDLQTARAHAYKLVESIQLNGMQVRKDIGSKLI